MLGKAIGSQRAKPITGVESLIGQKGPVRTPLTSDDHKAPYSGMVLVAGELWQARSEQEVGKGEPVIVTAVDGITLHVNKANE